MEKNMSYLLYKKLDYRGVTYEKL